MERKSNSIILIFMFFTIIVNAQNPSNDKSWELDASKSDEFSTSTIDKEKWNRHPEWGSCDIHKNVVYSVYSNSDNSAKLKNGLLSLYAKKEICTCRHYNDSYPNGKYKDFNSIYSQGALVSKPKLKYGYGYFEIRCKMPSQLKYKGINPSFWLYGKDESQKNSWNEIDIFEFNGYRNIHTCNVHYLDDTMYPSDIPEDKEPEDYRWILRTNDNKAYYDFQVNFDTFHTFACEWTPWYINFYYDDKLVRSTDIVYCRKLKPMIMYITLDMLDRKFGDNQNNISQNTNFPYEFQIDYIRYYTMKMDCKTVVNQSNFNFDKFDYAVKKSITIKNSSVPKNKKYTLRATDFIELQGDFEVPLGSELTLMPTPEF